MWVFVVVWVVLVGANGERADHAPTCGEFGDEIEALEFVGETQSQVHSWFGSVVEPSAPCRFISSAG